MHDAPTPYQPIRPGAVCTLPTPRATQEVELARLLRRHAQWNETAIKRFEAVKRYVVGNQTKLPPLAAYGNNFYNRESMGWWDAYRRATMLEPLTADILLGPTPIPGDFMEAGVFRGGISLYLASVLRIAGTLGNGANQRRLWMADAFGVGMPGEEYAARVMRRARVHKASVKTQGKNWTNMFASESLSRHAVSARIAHGLGLSTVAHLRDKSPIAILATAGVHSIPGYFNESLRSRMFSSTVPRRLALLRVDVDEFAATLEVLEWGYPRLSIGGYVVLDDWKIWQAQQAALLYRQRHNITSPIFASQRSWPPPLQSIDCMAFWMKQ